uniref:(northern house mosquito) hypothetical protein n=1 Tax=Culex pipiens TaxID=7175 RepID=A0A8D8ADR1_CULPI
MRKKRSSGDDAAAADDDDDRYDCIADGMRQTVAAAAADCDGSAWAAWRQFPAAAVPSPPGWPRPRSRVRRPHSGSGSLWCCNCCHVPGQPPSTTSSGWCGLAMRWRGWQRRMLTSHRHSFLRPPAAWQCHCCRRRFPHASIPAAQIPPRFQP